MQYSFVRKVFMAYCASVLYLWNWSNASKNYHLGHSITFDCTTYLLTYACEPLVRQRPPTRVLQASRSPARLSSCFHVWPSLLVLASRSRRQVFLGLPRFLFPCGFQVRARLVVLKPGFLSVCPTHPHRLRRISCSTGICLVCCHSSWLLIFSGHLITHWWTSVAGSLLKG